MRHPQMALIFLLALAGCQAGISVSTPIASPNPQASAQPSPSASNMPVPGGYFQQNPDDPAMQDIFKQAEKLLQAKYPTAGIHLTRLSKISSQVVAGANYSLDAEYTDSKGSGSVSLTVFRSLQGEFSLSSDNYH